MLLDGARRLGLTYGVQILWVGFRGGLTSAPTFVATHPSGLLLSPAD